MLENAAKRSVFVYTENSNIQTLSIIIIICGRLLASKDEITNYVHSDFKIMHK